MGENPLPRAPLLVAGAFGDGEAVGYTLYYATNFIFTGLAVAVAFHAGLFNIGGEGQAYLGGLGVGLLCLGAGSWPAASSSFRPRWWWPRLFGAAWAFVPAWLQARRGSHVVITTIMFNFIASALMTHLLVNVLIKPGQQSPETREFAPEHLAAAAPRRARAARLEIWRLARSTSRCVLALVAGAGVWLSSGTRARATSCASSATTRPPRSTAASRRRARSSSPCRISGALAGLMASTRSWACSTG